MTVFGFNIIYSQGNIILQHDLSKNFMRYIIVDPLLSICGAGFTVPENEDTHGHQRVCKQCSYGHEVNQCSQIKQKCHES